MECKLLCKHNDAIMTHVLPPLVGGVVCVMAGEYEPAARFGHVAAAVEDKVYVWGGLGRYTEDVSHDGPNKTDIILKVDILDVKVRNTLL